MAATYRSKVNERLSQVLSSEIAKIGLNGIDFSSICGSGKKLRPILSLLIVNSMGRKVDNALDAAVGIELIHNSTLVFDDIIDKTPTRRGFPTLHQVYDEGTSISFGLLLASKGVEMITKYNNYAMQNSVSEALLELSKGEMLDASIGKKITRSRYLAIARLKSGSLFGLSSALGAIMAGCPSDTTDNLWKYGMLLGIAYQIYDDLRDSDSVIVEGSNNPDSHDFDGFSGIVQADTLLSRFKDSSETVNTPESTNSFRRQALSCFVSEAKNRLACISESGLSDCMNKFADSFATL
jgi:geranylgeranyl pyrophosphate synthase